MKDRSCSNNLDGNRGTILRVYLLYLARAIQSFIQ